MTVVDKALVLQALNGTHKQITQIANEIKHTSKSEVCSISSILHHQAKNGKIIKHRTGKKCYWWK